LHVFLLELFVRFISKGVSSFISWGGIFLSLVDDVIFVVCQWPFVLKAFFSHVHAKVQIWCPWVSEWFFFAHRCERRYYTQENIQISPSKRWMVFQVNRFVVAICFSVVHINTNDQGIWCGKEAIQINTPPKACNKVLR
jgi:hypothetical protein